LRRPGEEAYRRAVTIQRLSLHGSKKKRTEIDDAVIERFLQRKATLQEALCLDDAAVEALRSQARALCDTRRWKDALDAFGGLAALGAFHHLDPVYWGTCHRGLGDEEKAEACFALAHEICGRIEAELAETGACE
jgi:hypothetical protein